MGTCYKGTKDEVRALNAYIKLTRAAESLNSRLSFHLLEYGLTMSQFGILEAIFHLGPLYQCDLSRKLLKSSGNITMVVDNLEKRGLVERKREGEDRRFVTIHLTEKGCSLIRSIFPKHVAAIREEMSVIAPCDQEKLGYLCRKLGLKETGELGK